MRMRIGLALFAFVLVSDQRLLESVRWWQSSRVISAIKLTPAQAAHIEASYASTLNTRCRLSESLAHAMAHVGQLNELDDPPDGDLLAATQQLGRVAHEQSQMEMTDEWRAFDILSSEQRESLAALRRRRLF